ncbi:hypothetical protein FOXYSP1_04252, partial [Fusarium oxysporum f. sp. phaseoli]
IRIEVLSPYIAIAGATTIHSPQLLHRVATVINRFLFYHGYRVSKRNLSMYDAGECHDTSRSTLRATGKKDKKYVLDGCRGPLGHSAHGEPCQWRDSRPLDRCVEDTGWDILSASLQDHIAEMVQGEALNRVDAEEAILMLDLHDYIPDAAQYAQPSVTTLN